MPASSKCSSCMIAFDCEAHFPMNCPCGRYSICEQCSIESLGWWKSYCCQSTRFEKDATFSKLAEERKKFEAVIAEQKQKLEIAEKLNMEKDAKIAELEKGQAKSSAIGLRCVECGVVNHERNLSICRTCTKEHEKIDILNCDALPVEKLRASAICKDCIPHNHHGHELLDYFSIWLNNYQTKVIATSAIHSRMEETSVEIKNKIKNMLKLLKETKEACKRQRRDFKNATLSLEDISNYRQAYQMEKIATALQKCTKNDGQHFLSGAQNNSAVDLVNALLRQQRHQHLEQNRGIEEHLQLLKAHHEEVALKAQVELMAKKNSTPVVDNIEAAIDVPKCPESDGPKIPGVQNFMPMYLSNTLKEQQRSQQSLKTGTDAPKCPENDGQKQSGVQNNSSEAMWKRLYEHQIHNFLKQKKSMEEQQLLKASKNEEKQKSEDIKFNQGFGGLKADNGGLSQMESLLQMHSKAVEENRMLDEMLIAISIPFDNIETGTAVAKCPENDARKQSGVQNGPAVELGNILQNSGELIDTEEFHRRCMNHFKNEEKQKSENLKFSQGFGGLEADNGGLSQLLSLLQMHSKALEDNKVLTAISKAQGSSAGFDPVTNSLANQFGNFGMNCNVPSTSAATQCNDKDSEDGSGSEASFEKI